MEGRAKRGKGCLNVVSSSQVASTKLAVDSTAMASFMRGRDLRVHGENKLPPLWVKVGVYWSNLASIEHRMV